MKKYHFFIILLLSISLYSQKKQKSDIVINIFNKNIKDGDTLNIVLKNNSKKRYYIIYDRATPVNYLTSNRVYKSEIELIDSSNTILSRRLNTDGCYNSETQGKLVRLTNKIEFLEIEPHQKIKFKIPFNMRTTISDYCWYEFYMDSVDTKEKYFVQFTYKFYEEYLDSLLCKNTEITEKERGYGLYNRELISNKVPLIME